MFLCYRSSLRLFIWVKVGNSQAHLQNRPTEIGRLTVTHIPWKAQKCCPGNITMLHYSGWKESIWDLRRILNQSKSPKKFQMKNIYTAFKEKNEKLTYTIKNISLSTVLIKGGFWMLICYMALPGLLIFDTINIWGCILDTFILLEH